MAENRDLKRICSVLPFLFWNCTLFKSKYYRKHESIGKVLIWIPALISNINIFNSEKSIEYSTYSTPKGLIIPVHFFTGHTRQSFTLCIVNFGPCKIQFPQKIMNQFHVLSVLAPEEFWAWAFKTVQTFQIVQTKIFPIGTSYLAKFQKRAVKNLKNYSTKNDENLRKPKGGQ